MKTSDNTEQIFAALVKAQSEMPAVQKTADNPYFKSKYAPLDAVVKAVQPVLSKHGLAVIQGGQSSENSKVIITTRIIHTSGEWIESELEMTPKDNNPQGVGACLTYGSRYGYRMLGVVTDEDDDGNSVSGKKAETKKPLSSVELIDRLCECKHMKELENAWKKYQPDYKAMSEADQGEVRKVKDQCKDNLTSQKEG